jgi:hypothetical protein
LIARADFWAAVLDVLQLAGCMCIGISIGDEEFVQLFDRSEAFVVVGRPVGGVEGAARLYGYLQLRNDPASLDEITRDLEMSRSNAFNAAKLLEAHGNAKRLGERGSKRIRFVAGNDPGLPLRPQTEMLGLMAAFISSQRRDVAVGEAADRLDHLAQFHRRMNAAMEQVIRPTWQNVDDRHSGRVGICPPLARAKPHAGDRHRDE